MKKITILGLLLLLSASIVRSQMQSPQQILDQMVSVYASCSSYSDHGEVKEVFFEGGRNRTVTKPFSTAFVRPSRFRFGFEEITDFHTADYVVWQDGPIVKRWWSIEPQIQLYENLSLALAGATGVSSSSAIIVPSMLMTNLGDTRRIQSLSQLSLKGEEKVSGKVAYRIEGQDRLGNLMTIWINKETFLLLKTFEKKKLAAFEVEATKTYEPQINVDISPGQLAFKH